MTPSFDVIVIGGATPARLRRTKNLCQTMFYTILGRYSKHIIYTLVFFWRDIQHAAINTTDVYSSSHNYIRSGPNGGTYVRDL